MRPMPACLLMVFLAPTAIAGDGVLEINQTCAVQTGCFEGDTAGFPVTISKSGSYALTSNLTGAFLSLSTMISITAENTSLNLRGFELRNSSDARGGYGIGGGDKVVVSNGSVMGFRNGITVGSDSTVDRLVIDSGFPGNSLGAGSGCRIANSVLTVGPVFAGSGCVIEGNRIQTGRVALTTDGESLIRDNKVYGVDGGISAPKSTISGNVVGAPFGSGISTSEGVISGNVVSFASIFGIVAINSTVLNNTVTGSNVGIKCTGCTVDGNIVTSSGSFGLDASGGDGSTGYRGNRLDNNNGGNQNPQVLGGIEMGPNICGGDLVCP